MISGIERVWFLMVTQSGATSAPGSVHSTAWRGYGIFVWAVILIIGVLGIWRIFRGKGAKSTNP